MRLNPVDLSVLILYLMGMVALGIWVGRRNTTPDQFMKAGGKLPGWAVGLSIFGTFVSSISFLALPGTAYGENWNAYAFSLAIPIPMFIAIRFFVPFYRSRGEVSAYHHLEARFGAWARTYAVVCYLLTQLARMGTIQFLLALALKPMTGWRVETLILVSGLVTVLYTWIGGMEAVIWADALQSVILIGGALACVGILLFGIPGGVSELFRVATEHDKFSLGSFGADLTVSTFWVVFVYGTVMNLQNFGIDQNFVQRYAAAASEKEARRSVWLGALMYVPISAVFLFIGTALFGYYTLQPDMLPDALDAVTRPDQVFPHFIHQALPVGVSGLVIAAIFAAAQSTLSSSINGAATLILQDLYRRYLRPQADRRECMRVLRTATVVYGLAGTGMALTMIHVEDTLKAWWSLAGIFGGGMLGLFLLGMIPRVRNNAALIGVGLGVLVILWMSLSPRLSDGWSAFRSPFHSHLVIVFGTLTILSVGFLIGIFASRNRGAADPPPREGS